MIGGATATLHLHPLAAPLQRAGPFLLDLSDMEEIQANSNLQIVDDAC